VEPPRAGSRHPARHTSAASASVFRRRRAGAALVVLGTLSLLGWGVARAATGPSGSASASSPAAQHRSGSARALVPARGGAPLATYPARPAAVETGLYPWQLPNPISREVVQPATSSGAVVIAGGLASGGSSDDGIYTLSLAGGTLRLDATLQQSTHDAAGALVRGGMLVVGGGTAAPSQVAQQVSGGRSTLVAPLPEARADATAVAVGRTAYVVGGYDGAAMDPDVLATTDGRSYRVVARLAVPVRYPAVAAVGSSLYVLGGQDAAGHPVATVQVIDTADGRVRLAGRLPVPLSGAAAADLGGTVYLAGGISGPPGSAPSAAVLAYAPASGRALVAGRLQTAVANAGATVTGGRLVLVGGELGGGSLSSQVQFVRPDPAFGTAGASGAGSPYFGDQLLIADRGNNRLIVLDDTGKVIWQYPSADRPAPPGGFYFPDDAFFVDHGKRILINQENNETLVELAYPSGKVMWRYGHPHQPGSAPGYLDNPDDAYLLRNGDISVADTKNCRILVLDPTTGQVLHQIGTAGGCTHNPPSELGSPNGDTPLPDGDLLVSEINGSFIDEYTTSGHLVWSVQLPAVAYPSDPQYLGNGRYLVVDYSQPGAIVEFDHSGRILYRYAPGGLPGELDQPSLGELLPSGVFLVNDDYNDRMVAIDPATGALVWQYGTTGVPGAAPGQLDIPDGFDLLAPGGSTPTHTATG
jgi:outer membrane protein assembly factor BamB